MVRDKGRTYLSDDVQAIVTWVVDNSTLPYKNLEINKKNEFIKDIVSSLLLCKALKEIGRNDKKQEVQINNTKLPWEEILRRRIHKAAQENLYIEKKLKEIGIKYIDFLNETEKYLSNNLDRVEVNEIVIQILNSIGPHIVEK